MIRFNDEFILSPDGDAPARELAKLLALLKRGDSAEQRRALARLIAADAQDELTECLRCADDTVVQLATAGLWECWLNEKGEAARQMMEEGIELMEAGHFASSAKIFLTLIQQHPDWAEAYSRLSLRDSGLRRGILPYNNNGIPIARMPSPQLVG